MSLESLKTGDILLFQSNPKNIVFRILDNIIKYGTHSKFTHVGIILKDPAFINPLLKGLYLWESSYESECDPQDGKHKFGVQITPLYEILNGYQGKIYVRVLQKGSELITDNILTKIHHAVYDKPYDDNIKDWIQAWVRKDSQPQKTDKFWCSALVAYILVRLNFLKKNLDWSIVRPCDFSYNTQYLDWNNDCQYSDDICLI